MSKTSPGALWQRSDVASGFVDVRRKLFPLVDAQEQLLRELISRRGRAIERFLDLGAGAGAFSELVLDAHPRSSGVLVDFSEPMIAAAEERLASYRGRWRFVRADLSEPTWRDALPEDDRYDAIVSGFCIHHFPDERKRALYEEAFALLKPQAVFLNWEHVSAGGLAEGMFKEHIIDRLIEFEQKRENPRPSDEVVRAFHEREVAEGDILLDVETQCGWLREIGFELVDSYFKLPELAIFGGVKGPTDRRMARHPS